MRIIFMGNSGFLRRDSEALVEAGHDVCLAVTQPDKPKGRGKGNAADPCEGGGAAPWDPGLPAETDP